MPPKKTGMICTNEKCELLWWGDEGEQCSLCGSESRECRTQWNQPTMKPPSAPPAI